MKKTLLIFITFLMTCSFVRDTETFSSEPLNVGKQWLQASEVFRIAYVMGYRDGAQSSIPPSIGLFQGALPDKKYQEIGIKGFAFMQELGSRDWMTIKDIMTSLYQDPANNNIAPITIIDLANKKLKGTLTEEDLRNARRNASK